MRRRGWIPALALAGALAAGCASSTEVVPAGTAQADQFLFERGDALLKEREWVKAREYFRNIVDNYPQSPYRPDAKLALGDCYMGEDTTESLLLAGNEFREFLTFYPTHPRADYAQLRLANSFAEQMLAPERDQSATKDAVKEYEVFLQRYPNSPLTSDARKQYRAARDRLSRSSYLVGFYYYRVKWYKGAIPRFQDVLQSDPEYTNRDEVYFHLAEALHRDGRTAEALPYYDRLLKEFEKSEYLAEARKRLSELKTP